LKTVSELSETDSAKEDAAPVRVFFLVDSFSTGGTETQAVELARRLDPTRYRVTLGCLRDEGPLRGRLEGSGVPIVEFYPRGGVKSPGGIYQLLRLAGFLRKQAFQVVHTHDLWSNLLGVPAARLAGTPVLISSRRDLSDGEWYTPGNRRTLRYIQKLSTAILANSEKVREDLLRVDAFLPEKIRVVYNGVDAGRFRIRAHREDLFPGSRGLKLVVVVGNMHSDVKGYPWFIQAAAEVVNKYPRVRFLLVGDGEMRPEFERLAQEAGVKQHVLFLGHRQDIPEILSCCDIGVLPSTAEGMPNAILEYLAAGLPTIATSVGGSLEVIHDGVTGLLVPPRDEGSLASAILRLLEDPELAEALASAGRKHVEENFSFARLISNMSGLYDELLGLPLRG
jgi:L-malate glycosyltransferase